LRADGPAPQPPPSALRLRELPDADAEGAADDGEER
jgi:hypothetical protein